MVEAADYHDTFQSVLDLWPPRAWHAAKRCKCPLVRTACKILLKHIRHLLH